MGGLFQQQAFDGFGPDHLRPPNFDPIRESIRAARAATLRKRLRAKVPHDPGVYGMLDRRGRLIYVGKAKDLRKRLLSYFRPGSQQQKAGRIIDTTQTILWESAVGEFAALVRELELIRYWRPRFNVQGVPGAERYVYLALGRAPVPYAYATKHLTGREHAVFGPFRGSGRVGDAARRINDLFGLRDCSQQQPMHFAEQGELFPMVRSPGCLRFEIGTCLGPCAALTTRAAYARHIRGAKAFLEGREPGPIPKLRAEMEAAAKALQFERAAALRDKIEPLAWVCQRLDWLTQARRDHSFVYPVRAGSGADVWYLIHQGRVRAAVAAPRDAATRRTAAETMQRVYTAFRPVGAAGSDDPVDHVLLVAGWFRRRADERAKILSADDARLRCQEIHHQPPNV